MPKFRVLITADVTASCTIEVEAATVSDAIDAACDTARNHSQEWKMDEENEFRPYCVGHEVVEQLP